MSTTTEERPPGLEGVPNLAEGMFGKALDGPGDPRMNPALLQLIQQMVPYAMTLIRAALNETNPRRTKAPTTGQIRELVQAQYVPLPDDNPGEEDPDVLAEISRRTQEAIEHATEAALVSAAMSFHGHWSREFAAARTLDELALNLIRIAYNRYQRRRRGDHRLGRQADSGSGAHAERSFLDSRADGHENPASEAGFREFLLIQRHLADGILEGFSVRDRRIVLLSQAGFEAEDIVKWVNRLHKKRRPCTLNTVNHVVAVFKAQVSRLEDDPAEGGESEPGRNADDERERQAETPRIRSPSA